MKINKTSITMLLMQCYVVVASLIGYSVLQQFFLVLFCFAALLTSALKEKIRIGIFGKSYIGFVVFSAIQLWFGIYADLEAHKAYMITIMINAIFIVTMYSFLYCMSINEVAKKMIYAYLVALLVILAMSRDTLLSGRLALHDENGVSFHIGAIESSISPNGVSLWCSVAFIFCLYLWQNTRKTRYLVYEVLFIIGVVLAGSRKGIIVLTVGFLIYYIYSGQRNQKWNRWLTAIGITVVFGVLIFENPILYKMIGYRIAELWNMIFKNTVDVNLVGGSLRTRAHLLEQASQLIAGKPFIGYGLNAFAMLANLHIVADNNYIEIMVSSGIIGTIIYYMWAILFAIRLIKTRKKGPYYYLALTFFVIGLISDLTGSTYYKREELIPFILATVIYYKSFEGGNNI